MQPSRQPRPPDFDPSRQPERNLTGPGPNLPDLTPNLVDPEPLPDWPAKRARTQKEPTMTTTTHTAATATAVDWTQLHADLSQPFPETELRYRAGATTRDKKKAQALPYVDPRAYEDRPPSSEPTIGEYPVSVDSSREWPRFQRVSMHDPAMEGVDSRQGAHTQRCVGPSRGQMLPGSGGPDSKPQCRTECYIRDSVPRP